MNNLDIKEIATTGSGMSALVKIQLLKEFRNSRFNIKEKRDKVSFPYLPHPGKRHQHAGINWQASPLYNECRTKSLSGDPNPRRGRNPAPSLICNDCLNDNSIINKRNIVGT